MASPRTRVTRLPRGRVGRAVAASVVLVALVLVVVAVVVGVRLVQGPDPAAAVTEEELTVPVGAEPDGGEVALDASVFTPPAGTPGADAEGRRASVLLAHGFGGSKDDLTGLARDLAGDGYVVLTWTARGFGDSGGLIHLDSPDFEVADAQVLLDALAARDDVLLDADGDPRVGVAGASYGGALALLLAGYDDRVDALVPAITWHDLGQAFFPQQASSRDDGRPLGAGVFKQRWASLFVAGTLASAGAEQVAGSDVERAVCGRFAPEICRLLVRAARTGRPGPGALDRLTESSPATVLDRVAAPTLLLQGAQDSLFGLDQAEANAEGLAAAGAEVAVRWTDGGHDSGGLAVGESDLLDPARAWFDHQLRDGPDPGTAFELTLPAPLLGDEGPETLTTPGYGDRDDVPLALDAGPQPVLSPAGGEPAAVTALPGAGALLGRAASASGAAFGLAALPGQTAVFDSEPVAETLTVAGAPRVRLSVTSTTDEAVLFASGWVVTADDVATLPRQLVSPVRLAGLEPGTATDVDVALPTSAYRLQPGERFRVVVASTDAAYAVPREQRVYRVDLASGVVVLPTVDATPAGGRPLVPWPLLVAVLLLLLVAALLALRARSTRRHRADRVEGAAEVPLVVEGLTKEYSDGFRAVDDVSWRAHRGEVVGLLGPNGAGKTTTMRMLVGLIRADAGRVLVHGEPVTPGAAALGGVGALIEGPGFLPHLTGRQNLEAWWAATGRPLDEAGFDEAHAVADLGGAIDRPVRSYSQGMRQRLGIAQAMLGRPEVLLLDEPTNGLDPPQIRGLRHVLREYAAGGRTVVVSSHLLAEVEQTCSHVVVMHRGRVVLAGSVPELLGASSTTVVGLDGPDASRDQAAEVLGSLDGVQEVRTEDGWLRVEGDVPRSVLVAALVDAGLEVASVDGRRHLEEVFMGLVGDDSAAQPAAGSPAGASR